MLNPIASPCAAFASPGHKSGSEPDTADGCHLLAITRRGGTDCSPCDDACDIARVAGSFADLGCTGPCRERSLISNNITLSGGVAASGCAGPFDARAP